MTKKAKVTIFFRPTVLHDHAASRLVKCIVDYLFESLIRQRSVGPPVVKSVQSLRHRRVSLNERGSGVGIKPTRSSRSRAEVKTRNEHVKPWLIPTVA